MAALIPLSCPTKLAFRAFLPRATSLSVTVVHTFILSWVKEKRIWTGCTVLLKKKKRHWSKEHDWPGILGPVHHVFDAVLISNKVDAHQASVTVGRVEGLEAVTQVALHCQASQAAAQMLHVGRRWYTCKLLSYAWNGWNMAKKKM